MINLSLHIAFAIRPYFLNSGARCMSQYIDPCNNEVVCMQVLTVIEDSRYIEVNNGIAMFNTLVFSYPIISKISLASIGNNCWGC